jgi:hypothetical protein
MLAAAIFDDVLQEARFLSDGEHRDAAGVLMRAALEDALKRLARDQGIDPSGLKAAVLNVRLKDVRYPQNQWRLNQACLDLGNDAAHGDFGKYDAAQVRARLDDVERFFASYLAI